jgi:stage II sporulation protein D
VKRRELLVAAAGTALLPSLGRAQGGHAPLTIDELYSGRLLFDGAGKPRIPIGLMERQQAVRFSAPEGLVLVIGEEVATLPAGAEVVVQISKSSAAKVKDGFVVETLEGEAREGRRDALKRWRGTGLKVRLERGGGVYGMRGTVVDNRAALMVLDAEPTSIDVAKHDLRPVKMSWLRARPTATLTVRAGGKVITATDLVEVRAAAPGGFVVARAVEHSIGYPQHGFMDMQLRGSSCAVVDPAGKLALVNVVGEDDCISGVLPSEMFASAPLEAIKAQAVTARGEVYAKIGRRHLTDPYLVCSSQHCQVYRGKTAEQPRTNEAARATAGELAFHDGRLVDSVYSACCGGHTEPAHIVWDRPRKDALLGTPDTPFADPSARAWEHEVSGAALVASDVVPTALADARGVPLDMRREEDVRAFLALDRDKTFCGRSSFNQRNGVYRWTATFTRAELSAIFADLDVGEVSGLRIDERGPGGRLRALVVDGSKGQAQVQRELPVRQRLKQGRRILKSGLFVIDEERDPAGALVQVVLSGAGNGHGSGMCQQGAIGMAESGYTYDEILSHYYGGATVRQVF